jgi:hypothetical protein
LGCCFVIFSKNYNHNNHFIVVVVPFKRLKTDNHENN